MAEGGKGAAGERPRGQGSLLLEEGEDAGAGRVELSAETAGERRIERSGYTGPLLAERLARPP